VPIRRKFADALFGNNPQLSLLDAHEAVLLSERAYFSSSRTIGVLHPGAPILFYESQSSGGRGAVIAMGRIVSSRIIVKNEISPLLRQGVLEEKEVDSISAGTSLAATSFDNILMFKNPVSTRRLQELGCDDGAHFVTARAIDYVKLTRVIAEGFSTNG
jgi:hypothetical protein